MATILYVEDNEDNLFIVHRRLTIAGFDVTVVMNGLEGVAAAAESRPDLIVMDVNLPGIDGLEATRRLKARADTRDIPIVVLTSHNDAETREAARAAGSDDFVGKPVDFPGLVAKINALLAKRPASGPSA